MAITIKEVALASERNQTTVSLVLNNHPKAKKFTSATRMKIRETAMRLGYQPNAAARALVMQKTNNIGIVIPEHIEGQWKNPLYASFLNGVNQACSQKGYNVLTFCCKMEDVAKSIFPYGIAGRNVDALLLCSTIAPEILMQFDLLKLPYARIGIAVDNPKPGAQAVFSPDIVQGLMQAVEYLSRHNHTRIAILDTGTPSSNAIAKQLDGKIANSHLTDKVDIKHFFTADSRCDSGSASIFLSAFFGLPKNERPTTLITNPQTCLGVIKDIRMYNMKCPDDLSLISFYDYDIFDYITPAISSLSFDREAIAAYATNQLIEKSSNKNNNDAIKSKTDFPVSLNIRETCKTINGKTKQKSKHSTQTLEA